MENAHQNVRLRNDYRSGHLSNLVTKIWRFPFSRKARVRVCQSHSINQFPYTNYAQFAHFSLLM